MAKKKGSKSDKLFGIGGKDLSLPEFSLPTIKPVSISSDTRKITSGVLLIVITLILTLGPFGKAGNFGLLLYRKLEMVFGIAYPLIPLATFLLGIKLLLRRSIHLRILPSILGLISLFVFLALVNILGPGAHFGGYAGDVLASPLRLEIGVITSGVLLAGTLIVSILVLLDTGHMSIPENKFGMTGLRLPSFNFLFFRKKDTDYGDEDEISDDDEIEEEDSEDEEIDSVDKDIRSALTPAVKKDLAPKIEPGREPKVTGIEEISSADFEVKVHKRSTYTPPPITLLETDKGKPNVGDIKSNSNIIKRTLSNFGINVEMDEITVGPTVTRYALKPAQGVKLTRIIALQQDLALSLAAHPIRIEAPIPGKSLVGIEIPNKTKSMVGLASLFSDQSYSDGKKPLLVALGRGLSGKSIVANLAKMPHVLIAGTTGSGKSVTIHTLIMSLLYRNGPDALRLIFVDPKRVELTLYNGIPHLLSPVITQPKKAIMALKWAHKEMDRRYDILESNKVRDIESYHNTVSKNPTKEGIDPMPYIVIVIDELADLMQAYPRELEAAIVRLAQMSRAVGIHLVLSTQRPSVEVITGLIKANIPTRVALQVASQIDSRTILDQPGAEKLLGRGDMLYLSSESPQPERLQSAFISEDEVKSVVSYLVDAYKDELPNEVNFAGGSNSEGGPTDIFSANLEDANDDDDMYEMAREAVIEAGKGSTSYLQRKLKLGYARAARLMDMLESRGIIGPADGAKPREVLVKSADEERAQFDV